MGTTIKTSEQAESCRINLPVDDDRYFHSIGPLNYRLAKKTLTDKNQVLVENELVKKYFDDLLIFLKRKNISDDLRDDVVQETWLVVLQKFRKKEIRDVRKIRSFIFSVASNQLIMAFRKNQKSSFDELHDEPANHCNDQPDSILECKQLSQKIVNVVEQMSRSRDRELITMFFLTSCSKAEFSEKHGMSLAHFDRVKYRSKMRFIDAWNNADSE